MNIKERVSIWGFWEGFKLCSDYVQEFEVNTVLEADLWVEGVKYRLLLSKRCLVCGKKL